MVLTNFQCITIIRKIFIGGLSYSTDEDKLKKYFKNYGAVQDAVVMKDPVSKRSRGFGFITYYDVSSVDNALANEPHTIDSRKVEAKRAVPRSEIARDMGGNPLKSSSTSPHSSYQSTPSASPQVTSHKSTASTSSNNSNHSSGGSQTAGHNGSHSLFDSRHALDPKINMEEYAYNKIFVGGLHYDTRDAEFRSYFEKYGKVISAEVMFNRETHKSRGFGFIVFETEQGAVKVCSEKEHSIDGKVVEVKRAIPRSKLASGGGGLAGVSMTVSGATATSKALANSSGGQGSVNLRQDVRRTMSQGSEDSYSSQQQKVNSMLSPMIANNTLSNAIRKPYNAASGVNPAVRSASGSTSYAAALKLGGAAAEDDAGSSELQSQPPQSLKSASGDGQGGNSLNNTLTSVSSNNSVHSGSQHSTSIGGNIDLQSLLYSSSQIAGMDTRPFRSYSEPIVKFEGGSSGLVGDLLSPFDLNAYRGTAVSRNSNNSSRSSSILLGPDTAVNSRRQSFDLLNSSSSQQHFSLGQASNHPSSNSLANIPWLSSPANVSLDGSMGGTLDPNGLLLPGSSLSHSGPISLQLPTAVGTIGSGSARTPRSSFTASSLDLHNGGAVTPGNTIENLFGLPSSSPPRQLGSAALNSNNNSDSDFQSSMTTFQALQQQASQAHQQQQQYSPQHQYQQAPPHQYQQAPFHHQQQHQQQYANGGNGYSHGLMESALNLQQQQFPSHPQGAGPSADTWASMVMNHQRQDPRQDPQFPFYDQQQQQQALYQQQQHHPHQQHPMFQQSPSRQQPPHDSFYPPAQHQNHPHHYQQQQPGPFPPLQIQHQQLFANEAARQQGFNGFAGEFATAAAPPRRDQPKAASQSVFGGLHGGSSQQMEASLDGLGSGLGSEADDLFQFKDLHLGSAEFDPKAPWLYASRT